MSVLPFPVVLFSLRETPLDQINLSRWRCNAFRGFLLKYMQHIDGILETHGINGSPRVAMVRSHNFEDAGSAKAFERFSRGIDPAFLGSEERMSNVDPDGTGKGT
jgi:hypothetical protein